MKILIIEDNADLRDIFAHFFVKAGHQVTTAENGRDGLEKTADAPDIILLDLMMPEMNGYDFLNELPAKDAGSPFVVVVSNLSLQSDVDTALAKGAHAYLRKSDFAGSTLVTEVERLYAVWAHRGSLQ